MKKVLNNMKVYKYSNIEDFKFKKFDFPFSVEMFKLLKKENKLNQEYYYLKRGKDYAFFSVYDNKMNIFTFGKFELFMKLKVIGYPCSLSNCGYVTNNEEMMYKFIKNIKGAKIVLNIDKCNKIKDYTLCETLPTCMFENRFNSIIEYLSSLRAGYRRRIMKALDNTSDISCVFDNSIDIYDLYLNTYNKSNYKLEKLEKGFFDNVCADKLVFMKDGNPCGFVLLKKNKNKLIFMLCGMDYKYDTSDLYYLMLYKIIEYAIEKKCDYIDFGQTSEDAKLKIGCYLEKKYFYIHHSNKFLNKVAGLMKGILEYKYSFCDHRVFKE